MFEEAGIPTEGRYITNHSGKVTCATNLFMANFDDKMVRARTGHTSDSLQRYKSPSKEMEKQVSKSLQPPVKRPSSSTVTSSSSNVKESMLLDEDRAKINIDVSTNKDKQIIEHFKMFYKAAKECGSKSITIDLETRSMKISVD